MHCRLVVTFILGCKAVFALYQMFVAKLGANFSRYSIVEITAFFIITVSTSLFETLGKPLMHFYANTKKELRGGK